MDEGRVEFRVLDPIALYREKLAERHDVYPIGPDSRLWRDGAPPVAALNDKRAVA